MHIELIEAFKNQKDIIHNLSQFYLYEFSNYMPIIKLEGNALYGGLPDLDDYLNLENRTAFIIQVDDELAGFVLVKKGHDDIPNEIGEFFVVKKFSNKGIGKTVATRIFDRYPGKWLIHQMWNNYKAQAFWRNVVNTYTNGNYREYYDERRRPHQEFIAKNA
jgi:predicted acetyltransferase